VKSHNLAHQITGNKKGDPKIAFFQYTLFKRF